MSIMKTIRSLFKSSESQKPIPRKFIGMTGNLDMSDDATIRPHNRVLSRRERILKWQSDVKGDINHVKKDISTYIYTCKAEDDRFLAETEKVLSGMKMLLVEIREELDQVDQEILEIINTFPANRPCIIDVIAEEIGIPCHIVEHILIERETFYSIKEMLEHLATSQPIFNPECCRPRRFKIARCIYTTENHDGVWHNIQSMKPPNWQFVASKDVTYLERVEP